MDTVFDRKRLDNKISTVSTYPVATRGDSFAYHVVY